MKTHKQKIEALTQNVINLTKSIFDIHFQNEARKKALENSHLYDPVFMEELHIKYNLALRGLRAIRSVASNKSNESNIAGQVLFELGEEA